MPTANDITINSDPGVVSYVIGDFVGTNAPTSSLPTGRRGGSRTGTEPFVVYATSSFRRPDIAFGDFDGSGEMEVVGVVDKSVDVRAGLRRTCVDTLAAEAQQHDERRLRRRFQR
jgi:hypothetical protein